MNARGLFFTRDPVEYRVAPHRFSLCRYTQYRGKLHGMFFSHRNLFEYQHPHAASRSAVTRDVRGAGTSGYRPPPSQKLCSRNLLMSIPRGRRAAPPCHARQKPFLRRAPSAAAAATRRAAAAVTARHWTLPARAACAPLSALTRSKFLMSLCHFFVFSPQNSPFSARN